MSKTDNTIKAIGEEISEADREGEGKSAAFERNRFAQRGCICRLHRGAVQFKSSAFVLILIRLRRSELVTTHTEEKAIAAEAIIGESRMPKAG